jgi:hypothetical protein
VTETAVAAEVVSKGAFAGMINVSAGRISQYISEGKLSGDALVGQGRFAKINVAVAREQLRRHLDVGQMLGNGIDTRLTSAATSSAQQSAPEGLPLPLPFGAVPGPQGQPSQPFVPETVEDQIKLERLRQAQMKTRREAAEEEAEKGRFIETAEAITEKGRIAANMIQTFEGGLTDFAAAIAAEFEVPQRDVLHLLRIKFRDIRDRAHKQALKAMNNAPKTVETGLETESD